MPLIYITCIAGSGKSTIQKELKKRGYDAYGVDERGFSAAFDHKTGQIVKVPGADKRTPGWFEEHSWRTLPGAIEKLKQQASNKLVFLCRGALTDEVLRAVFDQIMCLDIDET